MDYELNSILAEKRDIILNRIRDYLKDKGKPSFQEMLQGSYIMKTGVKPIENLGYDIDVALRLSINENDYTASEVSQLNLNEGQMEEIYTTLRLGRHKSDIYFFLPKHFKIIEKIEPDENEKYGSFVVEVTTIFNKKIEILKISEKAILSIQ